MFDRCFGRENAVVVRSPAVHYPHATCTVTTGPKRKSVKRGCRCTAAAVLLLYIDFVATGLSGCL